MKLKQNNCSQIVYQQMIYLLDNLRSGMGVGGHIGQFYPKKNSNSNSNPNAEVNAIIVTKPLVS